MQNNQYWNGYGSSPWPNANYNPPQNSTNKIYVTSLDEALNKVAPRCSEMVYFHQDTNEFYVVKTDMDGRKSWLGFQYMVPNQDANIPATKADINSLLERIERIEKGGAIENAKSDG